MYKTASCFCLPEDENKLRLVVWILAAGVFFACSLILISGWCLENSKYNYYNHKRSELQYISTQMGACMDKHAYVTYGFVFAMGVHMLLLFDLLLHCMKVIPIEARRHKVCGIYITREQLAIGIGILIIDFVIYLAGVAEFHSDSQSSKEEIFHYFSAVGCIVLFWAVHFLICLYLLKFTLAPDNTYNSIRNVYFALTVLFFALWLLQIFFMFFLEIAKIVEWLLLLNGLVLQIYAERSLFKHMHIKVSEKQQRFNKHLNTSYVCACVIFTFVCTFVVFLFTAPPWFFSSKIEKNLKTGPAFWGLVTATCIIVSWCLCSASLKASMCEAQACCCHDGTCREKVVTIHSKANRQIYTVII
jgi:hypothetical protein